MSEQLNNLTLMAVHAHPDDEAISGGASLVRYRAEGVNTIVVTCTDGAEGEMHDPDLNPEEALPRMAEIRKGEMERAAKILNLSAHEWLGYRDSGMAGTAPNENPASFNKADLFEATGRLVKLVRKYRPQVMFSYNSFGGYGHPDHINAHKVASAAFDYAGDVDRYPEAEFGPTFEPSKLYIVTNSRAVWQRLWQAVRDTGEQWPMNSSRPPVLHNGREFPPDNGAPDTEITTFIDVRDYWKTAQEALMAHRTQINQESPFTQMRAKYADKMNGTDFFILFKTRIPAHRPENDLFEGIRK